MDYPLRLMTGCAWPRTSSHAPLPNRRARSWPPAQKLHTALTEALAALSDLPADASVTLRFLDPDLAGHLVDAHGHYATAEADAWSAARQAVAARPMLEMVPAAPSEPASGFLNAWAEFGLDTSRSRGSFKAAIPKPNLLKFPG